MEAEAHDRRERVTVVLTITDSSGNSVAEPKQVVEGPTQVVHLKAELGVPEESALWVVRKSGQKHQLADHGTHDVEEGDRYEAIVRGGVS